jgi:hypothetical protein
MNSVSANGNKAQNYLEFLSVLIFRFQFHLFMGIFSNVLDMHRYGCCDSGLLCLFTLFI